MFHPQYLNAKPIVLPVATKDTFVLNQVKSR